VTALGGGSVLQKGLSSSSKLRRLVDAADSAVPDRVPNGVKPTALRRAGKLDDSVPDADVPTGRMSAKLNDIPGRAASRPPSSSTNSTAMARTTSATLTSTTRR